MITQSNTKNDVNDARALARFALSDPGLLHPVKLRGSEHQKMLNLHEMRNLLIKQRTGIIVQMRAIAKSMGFRIPKTSTEHFHKLDTKSWPEELRDITWPMIKNLEQLSVTIKTYEKQIRELAATPTFKAQVDRLMEIHYVGLFVATGFVAVTGGDMDRFEKSRDIGPWLGATPKQDQSGDIDKQCHITKAGPPFMRRLLVESALSQRAANIQRTANAHLAFMDTIMYNMRHQERMIPNARRQRKILRPQPPPRRISYTTPL